MAASVQSLQPSTSGILSRIWGSSLGKKYVMAVTGLGLFIYVIAHMLGNLQIYFGPDKINTYAQFLKSTPAVLWSVRLALLAGVVLHVTAGIQLALANRRARSEAYATRKVVASTLANRTILWSGLIILAFIVFHLSHFTFGFVDPEYLHYRDSVNRHDVYRMMILGFSNPYVSVFYIISMGLLMLHLSHGVSSLFQSLGLRSKKSLVFFDRLAKISALLIFLGNCSIPIAILAKVIK
jgi:succinate dehydrogenase / fumarate reductase, cytochrome b subunit